MPEQRSRPRDSRVIALANQKGGTGKTTTTVNLGIGLARLGKKVLLIDADPQGDLTTCLGWQDQDSLQTTLATVMGKIIRDEPFTADEGILHHSEGVDLMPANIELSDLEATLVNAMSREVTLRTYVNEAKKNYDVVLIDCMPSLGMITINALAAADSVIIPVQAHYLPAKGMTQLIKNITRVKKRINPALSSFCDSLIRAITSYSEFNPVRSASPARVPLPPSKLIMLIMVVRSSSSSGL